MTDRLVHDRAYFEGMYATDDDPWGFDRRWYEQRKYDLTVAALPHPTFARGVEPGCANGTLTERLAERCERLVAFDVIPDAVERASARLEGHPHVEVRHGAFPEWWPPGAGDLVVWSEVAYYLTDEGLAVAAAGLQRWLADDGTLLAVHYTGDTDYPRHGSDVGRWLDRIDWLRRTTTVVDEEFELGVWRRVVPRA